MQKIFGKHECSNHMGWVKNSGEERITKSMFRKDCNGITVQYFADKYNNCDINPVLDLHCMLPSFICFISF